MVAPLRVTLDDGAHTAVARRYETTRAAIERTNCHIVLLAAEGRTAAQVAPLVRRSPDQVRRVLKRYSAAGLAGLAPRKAPGRPLAVPPAWRAELRRVIELDPRTVGVPSANWTTRLLADYLAAATGHRAGIETVREHLHRAGYVCKRPTWVLKRKAQEQPDWAKNG
jgi:transposase